MIRQSAIGMATERPQLKICVMGCDKDLPIGRQAGLRSAGIVIRWVAVCNILPVTLK